MTITKKRLRGIIRSVVPDSWRLRLRELLLGGSSGVDGPVRRMIRFARTLAAAYREALAVAAGQRRYFTAEPDDTPLRRNIHRLEKGLIRRPRRDRFALDYIHETVERFEEAVVARQQDPANLRELRWARDVLDDYFSAVRHDVAVVRNSCDRFYAVRDAVPVRGDRRCGPFHRPEVAEEMPSYEQLLALAWHRRSVRFFDSRPVPKELVQRAVEVGGLAPSACNRQPFEFRFFDEPELVTRIASLAGGAKGFYDNFPAIAVVVGRLRAYFHEKDRHVIYIDASLATMSFVLALETLGLSSCCINWPDIPKADRKMRRVIGLDPDERVVMLVAYGYADHTALVPYSGKKSVGTIARFNEIRR